MTKLDIIFFGITFTFQVPGSFMAMNRSQLVNALVALRSKESSFEAGLWLFLALLDLKWWQVWRKLVLFTIPDNKIAEALEVVLPFIKPEDETELLIKQQLIPSIRIGFTTYYGPADILANCSAEEFAHCELHFRRYNTDQDIKHLAQLVAILYRPGKPKKNTNDYREPFNEHLCAHRAKRMAKIHLGYLYYALELFRGAQFNLQDYFPSLFEPNDTTEPEDYRNSWVELIISVAGEKFGTIAETGKANVGDIFLHLRQIKEENDQIKKMRNSNG